MANEYSTLANLKLQLGGITASTNDNLLNAALTGASRRIDRRCGRRFYADSSATARTLNPYGRTVIGPGGEEILLVDDISSTTGLTVETGIVGGTYTATTSYELLPESALTESLAATKLRGTGGQCWRGGSDSRVRVTARWGWPAVPDEVTEATLILAARLYRRKDSPDGVSGNAEWGVMRLPRLDPDVESLIAPFVLPGVG